MAVAALSLSECESVPVRQHHVVEGHLHRSVATQDFRRIDCRDGSVCECLSRDNEEGKTSIVYRMNVRENFKVNPVVKMEVGRREIVQQTQSNGRRVFNDQCWLCWVPWFRRRHGKACTLDRRIHIFPLITGDHCIDYGLRDVLLTQPPDIF